MKKNPTCFQCYYYNLKHGIDYDHDRNEYDTTPGASFCGLHGCGRVDDPTNPPPYAHTQNDKYTSLQCGFLSKQQNANNNVIQLTLF